MADAEWARPDEPSKCTYQPDIPLYRSPHFHQPLGEGRPLIASSCLDLIGHSPLVRLNRIPQSEGVECEWQSASSSTLGEVLKIE
ncbi:hypothetical protein P879_08588 [Paragonimus westermani]|uniref:Uncharacterized protein n=1 Tax=Paragonimus westermani TaxID=34504 RepID=A0A8T0DKV7_9TREM|nr:hypothetical protein P879_08588 [Paragonimus westermani]